MKQYLFLALAVCLTLSCREKAAEEPALIHATYSVLSRIVPEELFPERQ